ncbi:MAG: fucose isomerase [Theionarchaea archaeon DG-70-1]|nr:MAG: fucose isomerase [Theionarchaea archaeon DG-70-1]
MKESNQNTQTFAVIVGNREYFPDQLAEEGGKQVIKTLEDLGFKVITLSEESGSKSVQTREESKRCALLFKENAEDIDGVVVTLPNFGDEKGVAETLRLSNLNVPVLVHAFPDEVGKMNRAHRRDSFCGKFSVCNNLYQYGINFTNTQNHVEAPDSQEFKEDLILFGRVCKTVKGLRNCRLGVLGVRPNAFKTVRYSEKILERNNISIEIVSLMEIVGRARELKDDSPQVEDTLNQMRRWFNWENVPQEALMKTAKLTAVLSEWIQENEVDALSFNCWPAIEKYYEIVPCAAMSLVSEWLTPAACETDVMGSLSMYALQLASGKPTALVDLNNNYGDDPDKCVLFHCSALAPSFFEESPQLSCHEMQGFYGSLSGKIAPGPVTLFKLSTDDVKGSIRAYFAEGRITEDEIKTFGTYGVVEIEELQSLLKYVADKGFEHHVAIVKGFVADILEEAVKKYLGWKIYRHSSSTVM